jgi:hypothetical protein
MSEISLCNFCMLHQIRQKVTAEGKIVHIEKDNGILKAHAYAIAPTDDFKTFTHKQRRDAYIASFMELPEVCAC